MKLPEEDGPSRQQVSLVQLRAVIDLMELVALSSDSKEFAGSRASQDGTKGERFKRVSFLDVSWHIWWEVGKEGCQGT